MMDLLNKVIDIGIAAFGANPFEVLFVLILLIVFLWLYRELRNQQAEEIGVQKEQVERSLVAFSLILSENHFYQSTHNEKPVYEAIYSALPFMDFKLTKKVLSIMDNEISESEKFITIANLVKEEVLLLSGVSNRHAFKTKLLTEEMEKYYFKVQRIFGPAFVSIILICSFLLLFSISFSGESYWWMLLKPICFAIAIMLLPMFIDLVLERKLTLVVGGLLVGIFISTLVLTNGPEKYALSSFLLFVILLGGLAFYAYKQVKNREEVTH